MNNILYLFILLVGVSGYSQDKNLLEDPDYIKFEKESIELYTSKDYINYENLKNKFSEMLPDNYVEKKFKEDFKSWITKNLDKSGFTSVEEAVSLDEAVTASYKKIYPKQEELNKIRITLIRVKKYDGDEFSKLFDERIINKVWELRKS